MSRLASKEIWELDCSSVQANMISWNSVGFNSGGINSSRFHTFLVFVSIQRGKVTSQEYIKAATSPNAAPTVPPIPLTRSRSVIEQQKPKNLRRCASWRSEKVPLTHSVTDNFKSRDASVSTYPTQGAPSISSCIVLENWVLYDHCWSLDWSWSSSRVEQGNHGEESKEGGDTQAGGGKLSGASLWIYPLHWLIASG